MDFLLPTSKRDLLHHLRRSNWFQRLRILRRWLWPSSFALTQRMRLRCLWVGLDFCRVQTVCSVELFLGIREVLKAASLGCGWDVVCFVWGGTLDSFGWNWQFFRDFRDGWLAPSAKEAKSLGQKQIGNFSLSLITFGLLYDFEGFSDFLMKSSSFFAPKTTHKLWLAVGHWTTTRSLLWGDRVVDFCDSLGTSGHQGC